MWAVIYAGGPAKAGGQRPSFARVLVVGMGGVLLTLGLALLASMLWQGISTTRDVTRRQIEDTADRALQRLRTLTASAEMTAGSVRRAALANPLNAATLRPTLENALAAFEQRPELSYIGIVLPGTGEYGNLERTDDGTVLLWLFPASRPMDPVTRTYVLARHGFALKSEVPNDGYDPRTRAFYKVGLAAPPGGAWMPAYQWIIHSPTSRALWGLSFMQSLHDDAGRLTGVLDTDLDLPALNRFVRSVEKERPTTRLQVIELGATPRLIADPAVSQEPLAVPPEFAALARSGQDFSGTMQLSGERRWVAARRLDLRGGVSWLVLASRPDPIITDQMRKQLYNVLEGGTVILVLMTLAFFHMARRLSQPLAQLARRAARIEQHGSQGPPDTADAVISAFRETQQLCAALDQMALTLQQRHDELRSLNAQLEERVANRTNELSVLNRELETFCYSVSHDLRAPLRGIAGFTQIIAKDHAGALDDTARRYLDRVLAATVRMGELIDDLLKLSQVSRDEMQPGPVDLSALANTILADLQQAAPQRRVQVHVQEGLHTQGDPRLLRAALENLLGNAWKFTSRTAEARIEFSAAMQDGVAGFAVTDNGAGFDMRYAGKLFGPFQRLHRMDEFPGTGIGLATVQRIIMRHGGRITARAEPGRGATFWFTLKQAAA